MGIAFLPNSTRLEDLSSGVGAIRAFSPGSRTRHKFYAGQPRTVAPIFDLRQSFLRFLADLSAAFSANRFGAQDHLSSLKSAAREHTSASELAT
jgi:hypothetical protein